MTQIEPGLAAITGISNKLKQQYNKSEDKEWEDHPLAWIRNNPSARIGKIGRLLVQGLCENAAIQIKTKGYSLLLGDKEVQVRFSTGWSGGSFKFEQLRDETYDAVFCLGITPQKAFAWLIPKKAIFNAQGILQKKDGLTSQHKGKVGSDTAWINVDIQSIPSWMMQYGDSVADAVNGIAAL